MDIPIEFRRKMIITLIEALKESPSFCNIQLTQLKEAVLNSENQTYQQSKNREEYVYYINEKLRKIKNTPSQKFEFRSDSSVSANYPEDPAKRRYMYETPVYGSTQAPYAVAQGPAPGPGPYGQAGKSPYVDKSPGRMASPYSGAPISQCMASASKTYKPYMNGVVGDPAPSGMPRNRMEYAMSEPVAGSSPRGRGEYSPAGSNPSPLFMRQNPQAAGFAGSGFRDYGHRNESRAGRVPPHGEGDPKQWFSSNRSFIGNVGPRMHQEEMEKKKFYNTLNVYNDKALSEEGIKKQMEDNRRREELYSFKIDGERGIQKEDGAKRGEQRRRDEMFNGFGEDFFLKEKKQAEKAYSGKSYAGKVYGEGAGDGGCEGKGCAERAVDKSGSEKKHDEAIEGQPEATQKRPVESYISEGRLGDNRLNDNRLGRSNESECSYKSPSGYRMAEPSTDRGNTTPKKAKTPEAAVESRESFTEKHLFADYQDFFKADSKIPFEAPKDPIDLGPAPASAKEPSVPEELREFLKANGLMLKNAARTEEWDARLEEACAAGGRGVLAMQKKYKSFVFLDLNDIVRYAKKSVPDVDYTEYFEQAIDAFEAIGAAERESFFRMSSGEDE